MLTRSSSHTGLKTEQNDSNINGIYLVVNMGHILDLGLQSRINIEEINNGK